MEVWIPQRPDWIQLKCWTGCSVPSILEALGLRWDDIRLKDDPNWKPPARTKKPFDRRGAALEAAFCVEALQADTALLERLRLSRGWAATALRLLEVGSTGKPRHPLTLPVWDKQNQLHDVLRYDPFLKQGRKVLAGERRSRQPWPAPERVRPNGRPLFIVEGEGTAISLASIGVNAVGLPGSVSRPNGDPMSPSRFSGPGWHTSWAQRFRGHVRIVLMNDCDESGRSLMNAVRFDLERVGFNVCTLDLRAQKKGFDVGDFLAPANTLALRREARGILLEAANVARNSPQHVERELNVLRRWYAAHWKASVTTG